MEVNRMKRVVICLCLFSVSAIAARVSSPTVREDCLDSTPCGIRVRLAEAALPHGRATDTQQPTPNLPLAQLQRNFKSLPFKPGEKLTYELKFVRFPFNTKVGEVTFEYVSEASADNWSEDFKDLNTTFTAQPTDKFYRLRASAVSKGILTAIIGFDVNNRYATLVNREDFSARLHWREIKEGKKRIRQSALFDGEQVTYQSNHLNQPEAPAKTKALPRQPQMLDLLSAFFFVRLQKLKEGELVRYPVSDDGVNYTFDIVVGKKEQLKTDCGKIKTIRIEPKLFGKQQLFGRAGTMTMWLTDNKEHVPVKMIAKTGGNTISARLMNFKTNCQIAEPEQEELK
jgi:hypothetical protein